MVPLALDGPAFATDVPLFVGVPGGPELLVILLIAIVMFGLPVVLLGGLYLYRRSQSDRPAGEELAALRREVELLREEINRLDDESGGDDRLDREREGDPRSNDER